MRIWLNNYIFRHTKIRGRLQDHILIIYSFPLSMGNFEKAFQWSLISYFLFNFWFFDFLNFWLFNASFSFFYSPFSILLKSHFSCLIISTLISYVYFPISFYTPLFSISIFLSYFPISIFPFQFLISFCRSHFFGWFVN